MATGYVENVFVNSPTLLDAKQGPFSSIQEAQTVVPIEARSIGLFHFIDTGSGARLYWYKNGIEDGDLILFSGNNSVVVLNTYADFPRPGDTDVIYVDKSTSSSYYWDTALAPPDYVLSGSGTGSVEIYPKYESGGPSDIPGVDYFPTVGVENVIYIANDTDFSYYWDPTANANAGGYIKIIGNQGKSAYEVWLELGNNGTPQDFIDSLKGAPGDGITINGLNYVGDWEVIGLPHTYAEGDVVVYLGSSYVRINAGEDTVSTRPPDVNPDWGLLTSKGAKGDKGDQGDPGAQGVPGPQGNDGATGPAGLNWRGTWSSTEVYIKNDAVGFGGASYFCVTDVGPSVNDPTVDTVNWALLANIGAKGDKGDKGDPGLDSTVPGPQGPQGPAGVLLTTVTDNITGAVSIAPGTSEIIDVVNSSRLLEGAIIYIDGVGYFTVLNISGSQILLSNDFSQDTLTIPDASTDFRLVIVTGPDGPIGPQGDPGTINVKGNIATSADLGSIANPQFGDVWVTQDDFHGWVYTPAGWVDLGPFQGPPGDDGNKIFSQSSEPTANFIGDIWIDIDDWNIYEWDGSTWTLQGNIKGADGAGAQNLQEVTDQGNTTTNDIALLSSAKVTFDNGSALQKGTTDSGNGGVGGIALKCSILYELKWEAGRLYVMEQDGFTIREVRYTFTSTPNGNDDNTKGFVSGSRWILDNGETWVCSDANTGTAIWNIETTGGGISYYTASGSGTYTVGGITTYNTGDTYLIKFTGANAGASTLNGYTLVNSKTNNSNLVSGDIRINETHLVVFDADDLFQVLTIGPNSSLNPSGGTGAGSGAIVDMGYRMNGVELVDMGSRI